MQTSMLIVYTKKGAEFKPGSLVGDCALQAQYVKLENGDAVGVLHVHSSKARKVLQEDPNITVLPPMHRPLTKEHIALLSYAGAASGDTTYDVAEKLFRTHRLPWLHPEEGPYSTTSIDDMPD